jgi:hypothetical protein
MTHTKGRGAEVLCWARRSRKTCAKCGAQAQGLRRSIWLPRLASGAFVADHDEHVSTTFAVASHGAE